MDRKKPVVPDEVTTDDVMKLFGWSRSEVSRRRRSGDLPEPDPWRGSERKPRWSRQTILDSLARLGRLDGVVLAAFEGSLASPVRWGRMRDQDEFMQLPEMQLHGEGSRTHLYRVVRYLRRDDLASDDSPESQLSLCIAIDDPNPHRVFNALLVRSEVAYALGYGTGKAGTIAVIFPADESRPQLWFARIPADFPPDHVISLEQVPDDQMPVAAHLLGHPLPVWTEKEITMAGAAKWDPAKWAPEEATPGEDWPAKVALATPRDLTEAQTFRRICKELLERIEAGTIQAPSDVPDSLRGLVYRAWEAPLMNMRHRHLDELPKGWAWLFQLPEPPEQAWPKEDMSPALRWLATSPHAPADAAEFATRYFGYDASIGVAVIDLNKFTPTGRAAIQRALIPAEPGSSWLDTTLQRALHEQGITDEARQHYRWNADPDPESHPAVRVGDTLAFHVPRRLFPLGTPAYTEVAVSGVDDHQNYGGILVDLDGQLTPMPIRPDSQESVESALTAAVWAPSAELFPGSRHVIGNVPNDIRQLTKLLTTGDPLHLDWEELATATGPGPGPHADWQQLYLWRQGDPPIDPS